MRGGFVSRTAAQLGNMGGDWVGWLEGQEGVNGKFDSADPFFCDWAGDDFTLRADSPCAGQNNPPCGQIGAWGVGCEAPTPVERVSWGRIKAMYGR